MRRWELVDNKDQKGRRHMTEHRIGVVVAYCSDRCIQGEGCSSVQYTRSVTHRGHGKRGHHYIVNTSGRNHSNGGTRDISTTNPCKQE